MIRINQNQSGTTLSADVSAMAELTRTFHWTIDKSVNPSVWNLFRGDSGTSQYTIMVTKDEGTLMAVVEGQVCVTNGGAVPTENLAINVDLERNPGGGFVPVVTNQPVDVSDKPVLQSGETFCYDYSIMVPADQLEPGDTYRVTANVTITNHSGHLGMPFGPSPRASTTMPTTPVVVNDTITVTDTNGGQWTFDDDATVSYCRTFTCDADEGTHTNTATIVETGQSDSAMVTVNCYELDIMKTADTSFTRTYDWNIEKTVSEDGVNYDSSTTLVIPVGVTHLAYYKVVVNAVPTDSDYHVEGEITITNNAPIPATINNVTDVIPGIENVTVDCGVNFPFVLPGNGGTITCTYEADLPDALTRLNTATVTLQNFNYDQDGEGTPFGTTDFSDTEDIVFSSEPSVIIDESVLVSDSVAGGLGQVDAADVPAVFSYTEELGPYFDCGTDTVENTACFVTNDTGTTECDSATVFVEIPCEGCTFTIGYWKTHAGFTGNNPDVVTPLLPQWLGTLGGAKSIQVTTAAQAVEILNFNGVASNGINRLYAQLLAAKLNIENGADPSAVASVIAAADAFLATHNASDWDSLTRLQRNLVNQWQTTLDNYNNGLIGPGHCSESGEIIDPFNPDLELDDNFECNRCGVTINVNISNSSNFNVNIDRNRFNTDGDTE